MNSARAISLVAGLAVAIALLPKLSLSQTEKRAFVREGSKVNTQDSEKLPIRRITLYRSGVGSFERRGLVDGNASVQLRFKADQINDILKSMVVLDLSKGKGNIDGVSYGSKEPLSRRLSSFGIDISDNPASAEILQRLRGTQVRLSLPEGQVTGTIMNVEDRPTIYTGNEKNAATRHDLPWINLLSDTGVKSYNLTTVTGFEILDKNLAQELSKALAALAEHRADRTKSVEVNLSGEGAREIVIAYVEEMPSWKTSYRLVLPDEPPRNQASGGGKAAAARNSTDFTVQGWAIVENTTDEDWQNVALSLVAGRPVSFRMDLYEPLYVFRPEVPVPTVPGVLPRIYAGSDKLRVDIMEEAEDERQSFGRRAVAPGAPASAGQSPFTSARARPSGERDASKKEAPAFDMAEPMSAADMAGYAARSQARAVEAGEVFQFQIDHPVTVERQRSAMIPIISAGASGRRVSIYNRDDSPEHPMRGVELTNSTTMQLMPGPISVFDGGAYAGDAQIGHVPIGDKRLLAYAVDLDVKVTREQSTNDRIQRARLIDGALQTTSLRRATNKYTFTNKDAKRDRLVIVEEPRLRDWKLTEPSKPAEQNETLYRFEVPIEADKQGSISITQEFTVSQAHSFMNFDSIVLLQYVKDGVMSQKVVDAFNEAAKQQQAVNETRRRMSELEQERQLIDTDQSRIRQNMNGIDRASQLYARYMQKLTEQEAHLEAMAKEVGELKTVLKQQQEGLESYIRGLNIE